ncbi:unnamed protein product [Prunus brigantina]
MSPHPLFVSLSLQPHLLVASQLLFLFLVKLMAISCSTMVVQFNCVEILLGLIEWQ